MMTSREVCPRFKPSLEKIAWSGTAITANNRVRAIHCWATYSVFSQNCGRHGWAGAVRFDKFRESCAVELAACREASSAGRVRIGTQSYAVEKNTFLSHMTKIAGFGA
jgi:hypothetical protein